MKVLVGLINRQGGSQLIGLYVTSGTSDLPNTSKAMAYPPPPPSKARVQRRKGLQQNLCGGLCVRYPVLRRHRTMLSVVAIAYTEVVLSAQQRHLKRQTVNLTRRSTVRAKQKRHGNVTNTMWGKGGKDVNTTELRARKNEKQRTVD